MMKSGKQRKLEIKAARLRRAQRAQTRVLRLPDPRLVGVAICNPAQLVSSNSYGYPEFVQRGNYVDIAFCCKDCGAEGVWTAGRQKWWYEVAKGHVETRAVRCKLCRARERARKEQARRGHLDGMLKKQAMQNQH